MPSLHGTHDHLGGLGHVQAALGLQTAPQGDVSQARVIGQAGVVDVVELDDHARSPDAALSSSAGPENWLW